MENTKRVKAILKAAGSNPGYCMIELNGKKAIVNVNNDGSINAEGDNLVIVECHRLLVKDQKNAISKLNAGLYLTRQERGIK